MLDAAQVLVEDEGVARAADAARVADRVEVADRRVGLELFRDPRDHGLRDLVSRGDRARRLAIHADERHEGRGEQEGADRLHDHARKNATRDSGIPVLVVSTELDEVVALADRIMVLYRGRIVGIVPADTPRETLGLMMTGERPKDLKDVVA